jgi:hypothetical protein
MLGDGPIKLEEIKDAAKQRGISFRTLERSKSELDIESLRRGFGMGSVVYWALPRDED